MEMGQSHRGSGRVEITNRADSFSVTMGDPAVIKVLDLDPAATEADHRDAPDGAAVAQTQDAKREQETTVVCVGEGVDEISRDDAEQLSAGSCYRRLLNRIPIVAPLYSSFSFDLDPLRMKNNGHDPDLDPLDMRGVRAPRFLYFECMYYRPGPMNTWVPAPDVELRFRRFRLSILHKAVSAGWFCLALIYTMRCELF